MWRDATITQLSNGSSVFQSVRTRMTNHEGIAAAFGNTWVGPCALQREDWPTPTESGRGAALSLEGHLIQPTLAMMEALLVLEEPSLAEQPPMSVDLKEAWGRSTGLPLDPEMVQQP